MLTHRAAAQNSYVDNGYPELFLISGSGATAFDAVTHSFLVRRTTGQDYARIMRLTNAGRLGVGNNLSGYTPVATFNVVHGGFSNLSVDRIGDQRYNGNVGDTPGILGGGACLGFNATRQSDAAIVCEGGTYDVPGGTPATRNGGGAHLGRWGG